MTDQVRLNQFSVLQQDAQARTPDTAVSEHGVYRGQEAASAPDMQSMIQDSAEEMTFGMAEKVEKKLSARKMGREGIRESRLIALINKLQQALPDFNRDGQAAKFMQQLLQMLKQGGGAAGALQLARQFYQDPSHQFAALQTARELFGESPETEALTAVLDQALAELEQEQGPSIRAGFNISQAAAEMEREGLSDIQQLRDLYRAGVLGFEDVIQAYETVIREYGAEKFDKALEFLMKAVSADLESMTPSTDPLALKEATDGLFYTRMLGGMHGDMAALIERMNTQFGVVMRCVPQDLMREMINLLKQQFVSEGHFRTVVDYCGRAQIEARIDFLREWLARLRRLPLKIYTRPDQRSKLLDAGQTALDGLITEEEEGAW